MMSRKALLWAILGWTAVAWGGRVAILVDTGAGMFDRVRVGVSVLAALAVAVALLTERLVGPATVAYATVTAVVWGRSLVVVLSDPTATTAFRVVHVVLVVVSFALAGAAVITGRAPAPRRRPRERAPLPGDV